MFADSGRAQRRDPVDKESQLNAGVGPGSDGHEVRKLDDDQLRVAQGDPATRVLVLAGPGSGKTEVSARRIESLMHQGLRPSEILVLSFSRAAVRTLSDRLSKLPTLDERVREDLRHLTVRTFDSWAFRMLRNAGHPPGDLLRRGFDANIAALANTIAEGSDPSVTARLARIRHVVVDEMQDLAGVRGDLVVDLLLRVAPPGVAGTGFTLLGDSAQAIYGFANRNSAYVSRHGDTADALLTTLRTLYREELAEIGLDRNYRCDRKIDQRLAPLRRALLGSDRSPEEKHLYAVEVMNRFPEAERPLDTSYLAANGGKSVAILARTNGEVLRVAQKLFGDDEAGPSVALDVHHRDATGGPAWVAGILARVRASVISQDQFGKIYERARTGDGVTAAALSAPPADIAWQRLSQAATDTDDASSIEIVDVAERLSWPGAIPDENGAGVAPVCITTTHQSKGREFDHVAILEHEVRDQCEAYVPEEEASIVFVALSRAGTSVERLPKSSIYRPPTRYKLDDGRRHRLGIWSGKWVNIEMGLPGDVCQTSFADIGVHGGEDEVVTNFRFLAENCESLMGHKVVLRKALIHDADPSRCLYAIHLQEDGAPGRLLGTMNDIIVKDLLSIVYRAGYALPTRIFNLRISRVVSIHDTPEDGVRIAGIFERSAMWLGVELFGTGDFKPYRREGRNG